jgi:hypothetical protein
MIGLSLHPVDYMDLFAWGVVLKLVYYPGVAMEEPVYCREQIYHSMLCFSKLLI